jgi:hypothetical protein
MRRVEALEMVRKGARRQGQGVGRAGAFAWMVVWFLRRNFDSCDFCFRPSPSPLSVQRSMDHGAIRTKEHIWPIGMRLQVRAARTLPKTSDSW